VIIHVLPLVELTKKYQQEQDKIRAKAEMLRIEGMEKRERQRGNNIIKEKIKIRCS